MNRNARTDFYNRVKNTGAPFVDNDFNPNDAVYWVDDGSMATTSSPADHAKDNDVDWMRPSEFLGAGQYSLFGSGVTTDDI